MSQSIKIMNKEAIVYTCTGDVLSRAYVLPGGQAMGRMLFVIAMDQVEHAFDIARISYYAEHRIPPRLDGCTSGPRETFEYITPDGVEHDIMYLARIEPKLQAIKRY